MTGQIQEPEDKRKSLTNLRNCKRRAPLFLKDVKTNASVAIDIRVEDFGPKSNLNNTQPSKPRFRGRILLRRKEKR